MNLAERETTTIGAHRHPDTHLQGHQLLIARFCWLVLALAVVVLNILSFPAAMASFLPPEIIRELHELHFSLPLYLILGVGMNGLCLLLYLAMAVLLFWQRSDDRMAFFCSLMLLTFGSAASGFLPQVSSAPLAWNLAVFPLFLLGQSTFLTFFYLFPSGRFVPRWTRWFALLNLLYWTASFFLPEVMSGPPSALMFVFGITAVIAQVYRYRSVSPSKERQQTKWVVFGFVAAILLFILSRFLFFVLPPALQRSQVAATLLGGGSVYLALMLIPIFIGIAILRDQLFDIDLIINRTLVYGTLTACVVGFYVLVVGYLGALFRTSGNLLIELLATGLIAVLFQPLRNWLQRSANRLLYGLRDEPYVVLAGLGQRLETTLDSDAVLPTIVTTIKEALKLSYAAIEVKEGAAAMLVASSGSPPARETLRLPLAYQREPVGTLLIAPRGYDDNLTPADVRLLDDLAHQIGIAVHTVRLTSDLQTLTKALQRSREHLVTAREEERRRLRRDLHDGLGPLLSAVMLKVGLVRTLYQRDPAATDALLNQLESEIELVIADIRRLVYNLRPPALDEFGLSGAVREYAARLGGEAQALKIMVKIPSSLPLLPAAVEVAAYRIVQEAVTNVIRHAHAHTCQVRLLVDTTLQIEVQDDGAGFEETQSTGVGLISMRERAEELGGSFTLKKNQPCGTAILAHLPLGESSAETSARG
ncbi:histidine kinase [Ktedonobacter racemifer]|uniref:Multi-sensor signal transduction histidine kinase n=1 Tax=Ktedonobacter racemifer DSM 44963 TaxID=485913 RepID=D6TCW9_KTERA|nr:histidine kinase [Ktedonobacter racemifer]EFH88233.1 multi-sensor signal transduction histidine kinase [Ktedonobacter racemifer DSM 44963]